jgi:hypothetical protein
MKNEGGANYKLRKQQIGQQTLLDLLADAVADY